MPVYEYETKSEPCTMCLGRLRFVEPLGAAPKENCPTCGLEIQRVISKTHHRTAGPSSEAGGFSTYRKSGEGVWEKVSGAEGADAIVGSDSDKAAVKEEKKRVYDLDKPA